MLLFHSGSKFSPAILLIILLVVIVIFFSGLVLLLVKLLNKPRLSSIFQSNRHLDISTSSVFQRQLQNLFNLHDSGLDQALIDALPMFIYKDIVGLSGPFDCPVCLSEFSDEHKLRLLPLCKHAFHLHCIDTWLLSNSTCPLCRGTLFNPGSSIENPSFELKDSRNSDGLSLNVEPDEPDNIVTEKMVFSVRLGKFKHTNEGDIEMGETSSNINIDSRRCFSMGSVQFVVADTEFQVALCGCHQDLKPSNDGKMITNGNKRESFSVSKVWLWPKKSKIPDDKENHFSKSFNRSLPNRIQSSTGQSFVVVDDTVTQTEHVFLSSYDSMYDLSRQLNSNADEK